MIIKNASKAQILHTSAANGFLLADLNFHELVHLVIEPNCEVPPHTLPVDVTFFIIEGNGQVIINNQPFEAGKGDVVVALAHTIRGWKNQTNQPFELLVIKQKVL